MSNRAFWLTQCIISLFFVTCIISPFGTLCFAFYGQILSALLSDLCATECLLPFIFGFYLLCLKYCHADCFATKLPLMSDADSFDVTDYSGNGGLRNSSSVIRSLESGEIANMQSKLGTRTPQVYTCRKMLLGGQATRQKA